MSKWLRAIILAQPDTRTLGSSSAFDLPHSGRIKDSPFQLVKIPATPSSVLQELQTQWVSPIWRASDVPLPFHTHVETMASRQMLQAMEIVNSESRILQYLFNDDSCLTAAELLRHPHLARIVPRPLLPLTLQLKPEYEHYSLAHSVRTVRPQWLIQTDQAVISVLTAIDRINRSYAADPDDSPEKIQLLFTLSANSTIERSAIQLSGVGFDAAEPDINANAKMQWHASSIETLSAEPGEVFRGKVKLTAAGSDIHLLADTFRFDLQSGQLIFHRHRDRLQPVNSVTPVAPQKPSDTVAQPDAITGFGAIESTIQELRERDEVTAIPQQFEIEAAKPVLSLLSPGQFQLRFLFSDWEAHGWPISCSYLFSLLTEGFAGPTGLPSAQIAHQRRGPKRERDLKLLRHQGMAALLFYEAVSFGLKLPGTETEGFRDKSKLIEFLFKRFAQVLLRGDSRDDVREPEERAETQLVDLCSEGLLTILTGLVDQIIADCDPKQTTTLFLPNGEFKIAQIKSQLILFLRALLADWAFDTSGSCFAKVRHTWHESILTREGQPRVSDFAVRKQISDEERSRLVFQEGVSESFRLPTLSFPPKGLQLLSLAHQGFEVAIDGRPVELIRSGEFRPEFSLKDAIQSENTEAVPLGERRIDWFELHPRFFFRGQEIATEEALRLSREGVMEFAGKLYLLNPKELPSLKRLTRFWDSLRQHSTLTGNPNKRRKTEDTYFQLAKSRSLELLALRASGLEIQGGERWKQICTFYDSLDAPRPPLNMPETFSAQLQPYQSAGVQWLLDIRNLGLGGILADDMGLGKTVTSLGFLEHLRAQEALGATLVLVPTSLTYNWVSEMNRFTKKIPHHLFNSRDPESMRDFIRANASGVVICTYGLLQENVEAFEQIHWDIVIFDEAQALKTITTKRTTAARKLNANFKVCLTGTPLENHYGEFFSLFDLCVPGSLGEIAEFRERFVNPPRVLRNDLEELKMRTKPLLMRRTKAQVMSQLPAKIESTLKLPFDDEQRRIYRDIATSYNRQVRDQIAKEGEAKSQLQMLTALLRLRQVCSDPRGIPGVKYDNEPPKVSTLVDAIQEIISEGSSALIFTQFLATFERIRTALTQAAIPFFDMNGSDSRQERERKLKGFSEHPEGAVMLMTLKTGGVGLNLTKASYIFHIEPWWNPAVENQATDRAHRIGQTKSVQVYRYIIQDSVEEKIELLKELKNKRFDALFGDGINELETPGDIDRTTSRLSQKDFEFLLS